MTLHISHPVIFSLAITFIAIVLFSLFYGAYQDKKRWKEICDQAPLFVPFRAGHLNDNRGDAFGVVIPNDKDIPKPNAHVWVQVGETAELYTVRHIEKLTVLGVDGPARSPEVYIVINEKLSDALILKINKLGPTSLNR